MAKRRTSRTSEATAGSAPSGSPLIVVALIVLAFLTGLLAVYQWHELIRTMDGVQAFCSIGEGLDCAKVWNSDFAKTIHQFTGLPLAGWGLAWSFAALAAPLSIAWRAMTGGSDPAGVSATRWVGAGGAVACVVFFFVSVALGTLCLTCVTTYALVLAYAVLAFRLPASQLVSPAGLQIPAIAVLVAYVLLLYPGRSTPTSPDAAVQQAIQSAQSEGPSPQASERREPRAAAPSATKERPEPARTEPSTPLGRFLRGLPGPARRAVVDAVETYRESQPVPGDGFGDRPRTGPSDAAVRIVDFVDVGCGHCAHLFDTLDQIRRELPTAPFSVETRYFPLDGSCNAVIPRGSGDPLSARCLGAKLLLCAQGDAKYEQLKHYVFERHASLSVDGLYSWASEILGRDRAGLERCVRSEEVQTKLKEDVAYGARFNPRGTPLVVVNGREGSPLPPFLYSIILARGDTTAEGFEEIGF